MSVSTAHSITQVGPIQPWQVPSLFGLLQVTGCVNITWFIGFDKSCSLSYFFSCTCRVPSRKPCLHPDLSTGSELASLCAPADPNHQGQCCALVRCQDGNGDCGCQWVRCLPWLEIKVQVEVGCMRYSGRWCGFDVGWLRCYSVLRHTVALYP